MSLSLIVKALVVLLILFGIDVAVIVLNCGLREKRRDDE